MANTEVWVGKVSDEEFNGKWWEDYIETMVDIWWLVAIRRWGTKMKDGWKV